MLIVSPRVKSVKIYTVKVCKFFLKQPEQANYKAVEMSPEISVIFCHLFNLDAVLTVGSIGRKYYHNSNFKLLFS